MKTLDGRPSSRKSPTVHNITPCNFRSAGRLSNESARTLTLLHEGLARDLTNSLDVYLGTGLEVRLASLEQLSMDEFKGKCAGAGYMLPCATRPSVSTVLLEMDNPLMFTIIDLLLGGSGSNPEGARELTEIDEEIMEGVASLIAGQIERAWQAIGFTLTPGKCVKPHLAHRVFAPTEKVLRIRFDVHVASMTGTLFLAFQASLASHLVRHLRSDNASSKASSYKKLPSLSHRILDCEFSMAGELCELTVPVKDLARLEPGIVLTLSAPAASMARLTLEGSPYFEATPVRQGNKKAMHLAQPLTFEFEITNHEEEAHAGS
jgi:flagellar motor switch protein FliM